MASGNLVNPPFTLTEEQIVRFRAEWEAGTPTRVMGDMFHTNKNVIVSKRRRLGLAARPSPIKRPTGYVPPAKRATLPRPPRPPKPEPAPVVVQPRFGPVRTCCWIEGDLRRNGCRCEAVSEPGRSYCPEHSRRVYRPRVSIPA